MNSRFRPKNDKSLVDVALLLSFKPFADESRARPLPLFSKAITAEIEPECPGAELA